LYSSDTGEKWEHNGRVHSLLIHFGKASVRREILYDILIEFGIYMKPGKLIEMCLNETYNKVHMGKNVIHFLFRIV
jgi:hypothetical protein